MRIRPSPSLTVVSLLLGVLFVIPIGGADMPVIISFLNSLSGLAAAMTGFVLSNNVLIISGALVGASGLILTQIMCVAMNRTLGNVLFAGFGQEGGTAGSDEYGPVKSYSPEEAAMVLESAESVVIGRSELRWQCVPTERFGSLNIGTGPNRGSIKARNKRQLEETYGTAKSCLTGPSVGRLLSSRAAIRSIG